MDLKKIMIASAASYASSWIGDTVTDLYKGSQAQSFMNDTLGLGSVFKNDRIDKAISGAAEMAIKQGLTPDYSQMPKQGSVNPNLGKVGIGSTGDFNSQAQGQNMLYGGNSGAIQKAMTRTGVQQFLIGHISASKVVNPMIKSKRNIGNPSTSLKMASLKRGQIEGAR